MINSKTPVTIAVLDTGIAPVTDLNGRILTGIDLVNKKPHLYDDNGHGTHVRCHCLNALDKRCQNVTFVNGHGTMYRAIALT